MDATARQRHTFKYNCTEVICEIFYVWRNIQAGCWVMLQSQTCICASGVITFARVLTSLPARGFDLSFQLADPAHETIPERVQRSVGPVACSIHALIIYCPGACLEKYHLVVLPSAARTRPFSTCMEPCLAAILRALTRPCEPRVAGTRHATYRTAPISLYRSDGTSNPGCAQGSCHGVLSAMNTCKSQTSLRCRRQERARRPQVVHVPVQCDIRVGADTLLGSFRTAGSGTGSRVQWRSLSGICIFAPTQNECREST